jgi:hypothetical protein
MKLLDEKDPWEIGGSISGIKSEALRPTVYRLEAQLIVFALRLFEVTTGHFFYQDSAYKACLPDKVVDLNNHDIDEATSIAVVNEAIAFLKDAVLAPNPLTVLESRYVHI